jgi:hypothetical protein
MTVRTYKSTDASAPTLTGQAGSLTTLLDAVLVNGYGSQTAAGWTINQTTTNKRGYKQNLTGSNNSSGMLLYVEDTAAGAGGAKEARVCGFETMSAITPTGTGQFPTSAQSALGTGLLVIRKSNTADATARAWTITANGQTINLFIETGDITAPLAASTFVFGDFKSYKTSDQYAVHIEGRQVENSATAQPDPMQFITWSSSTTSTTLNNAGWGHYVARHWTGSGGSIRVGKVITPCRLGLTATAGCTGPWVVDSGVQSTFTNVTVAMGRFASTTVGIGLAYPNGPDGALMLSPIELNHSGSLRGYLYGLWAPLHDRPLGHNDTITFSGGNMSGKSIVAQNIQAYINSLGDAGQVIVETSDTWA